MTTVRTAGKVRQVAVPATARARSTLAHVDYADAFVVDLPAAGERTVEQWARAIIADAPPSVQCKLRWGWLLLGLKLGPAGSDRFVLGWEVRRGSPGVALLGAGSRIGMPAELFVERRQRSLLFCTFVEHDNPIARAIWAGAEPAHVTVVRRVLEHGRRHIG
jgi:hypothetical protein